MIITFNNLETDVDAIVTMEGEQITVRPNSQYRYETDEKNISFSLRYNRDFSLHTDELTNKLSRWLYASIGNAIVQIENSYTVSNLLDGDVIELKERAYLVPVTKSEAFFKCLPAFYYFGEVECEKAALAVVSAVPINHDAFISFYKKLLKLMNLNGWFRILKYFKQLKRQKKIADSTYITNKFKSFYELPLEERDYQFSPIKVIIDRFIDSVLSKLPKKLRTKAEQKVNEFKNEFFN